MTVDHLRVARGRPSPVYTLGVPLAEDAGKPGQTREDHLSATSVFQVPDVLLHREPGGGAHPARDGDAVQPVHVPGADRDHARQRDARRGRRRAGRIDRRGHPARAMADQPGAAPDARVAGARRGPAGCPRAGQRRSDRRSWPSSPARSTTWRSDSRSPSTSSAPTATAAASSWPTSRTSCARPSPPCAPSTSCCARAPATIPTTRDEFLEQCRRQIERLDWLATNLLEMSKLDSGPGLPRPATRRPAGGRRERRPAGRAGRRPQGRRPRDAPARRAGPAAARPAAHRPGAHQPHRQRHQVHAHGRSGGRGAATRPPTGARAHR